ncbi:MAG: hypothetical protein HYY78_01865 [Betaproteobacteria bacterium]|nr:hypothetical protein [Betaproteobacteria bacterium]
MYTLVVPAEPRSAALPPDGAEPRSAASDSTGIPASGAEPGAVGAERHAHGAERDDNLVLNDVQSNTSMFNTSLNNSKNTSALARAAEPLFMDGKSNTPKPPAGIEKWAIENGIARLSHESEPQFRRRATEAWMKSIGANP